TPDLVDAAGLHGGGEVVEGVRAAGVERGVAAADEEQVAAERAAVLRAGGPDLGHQRVGLGEQRQHPHGGEELLVGGRGQRHVAVAADLAEPVDPHRQADGGAVEAGVGEVGVDDGGEGGGRRRYRRVGGVDGGAGPGGRGQARGRRGRGGARGGRAGRGQVRGGRPGRRGGGGDGGGGRPGRARGGRSGRPRKPSGPGAKLVPRTGASRAATTTTGRRRRGGGVGAAHILRPDCGRARPPSGGYPTNRLLAAQRRLMTPGWARWGRRLV